MRPLRMMYESYVNDICYEYERYTLARACLRQIRADSGHQYNSKYSQIGVAAIDFMGLKSVAKNKNAE